MQNFSKIIIYKRYTPSIILQRIFLLFIFNVLWLKMLKNSWYWSSDVLRIRSQQGMNTSSVHLKNVICSFFVPFGKTSIVGLFNFLVLKGPFQLPIDGLSALCTTFSILFASPFCASILKPMYLFFVNIKVDVMACSYHTYNNQN